MNRMDDKGNVLAFPRNDERNASTKPPLEAVVSLRQTHLEADRQAGRMIVAFDRRDPAARLDDFKRETIDYLAKCLKTGGFDAALYGIGSDILRRYELDRNRHWTAQVLGLDRADDAMANALLSALTGIIATSPGPADIETALFGIGSFVHAHPRFAKILGRRGYEPPFGEHTDYTVCFA